MIKRTFFGFLILIFITAPLLAKDLGFFYAVKKDSVHIFLNQTLQIGDGFHVERRLNGEAEFQRLTQTPVMAEMNARIMKFQLGGFYDELLRALKLESAQQLLLKLRTEDYYGIIATLMDRNAARVLGRYFVAGDNQAGKTYEYRIIAVNRSCDEVMQCQQAIAITEIFPKKIPNLSAKQEQDKVILTWDYPRWSGENNDIAFQFLMFRSDDNNLFAQINERPLLRLDGMPNRFADDEIVVGRQYTYKIVAIDAIRRIGAAARTVIQTEDIVPPQQPDNLTAEVIAEKVHLSWQKNSEPDMQGNYVYHQAVNQKDTLRITPAILPLKVNSFVDSTMTYGVSYYYSVSAVDNAGNESRQSNRMD